MIVASEKVLWRVPPTVLYIGSPSFLPSSEANGRCSKQKFNPLSNHFISFYANSTGTSTIVMLEWSSYPTGSPHACPSTVRSPVPRRFGTE